MTYIHQRHDKHTASVTLRHTSKPLNIEPVCMAVYEATIGQMPLGELEPLAPKIEDMTRSTFALFQFAGERADKRAACVGCRCLTNRAWYVLPIDTTVPACNTDCLIDAVQQLWSRNGWTIVTVKRGAPVQAVLTNTTIGVRKAVVG